MNKKAKDSVRLTDVMFDDPFGLLDITPPAAKKCTDAESLPLRHFREVNEFVSKTGRAPSLDAQDMNEVRLAAIVRGVKADEALSASLLGEDEFGLLNDREKESMTLDDADALLCQGNSTGIFTLKHVERSPRINPATMEHRRRCANFTEYLPKFDAIKRGMKAGVYELEEFKEADLVEGGFYCLNGIVTYVEWIHAEDKQFSFSSCDRVRKDGPVHAVFDNGTESNMLYRSLVKALQVQGEGYSIKPAGSRNPISNVSSGDTLTGHIYVLRSKSDDPNIKGIKDLYKIGFSKNPVAVRIQNAEHESTYLRAPVHVLRDVEVYNMKAQTLEGQIHAFFGACNPSFTVLGEDGKQHYPEEWFVVPLDIVDKAIEIIVGGHGAEYHYVPTLKQIVHL